MFEYYYHEILRRTIISFGTLFNGIEIKHDDSDGDVSSVSIEGLFLPLGIDETKGIFHYRVNDTWYAWDFSEQTPRELKMDCPEQILFYEGKGYKKVGDSWFGNEGQLVSQLTASCHDGNYAHQGLGLIPYNAS